MPKPTLDQLRGILTDLDYTPRYAASVLRGRGCQVSDNEMRQYARGKSLCRTEVYQELLKLNEVK